MYTKHLSEMGMEWWKIRAWKKPWGHLVYTVRPREVKWLAQVVNVIQMVTGWAGLEFRSPDPSAVFSLQYCISDQNYFPKACCNAYDDVKAFSQSRNPSWTSLVVQESARQCRGYKFDPWSRPHASTRHRATKPMHLNYRAHELQLLKAVCLEPMLRSQMPQQWEAPTRCN